MQIRCYFLLLLLFSANNFFGAVLSIGNGASWSTSLSATYTGLTMANNASLTVMNGHTLTINGTASTNNGLGITVQTGGTLIITGCLNGNNNFSFNVAGNLSVGCIDIDNNGSLTIQGNGNVSVAGNFTAGQNTSVTVAMNGQLTVGGSFSIGTGTSSVLVNGNLQIDGQYIGAYPSGTGNMDDLDQVFLPMYLPVELKEIKSTCIDNRMKIQWITASEYNTSHYSILHSQDGKDWETLSTVSGAGTSSDEIEYSYTDENIRSTSSYYKVIQYDIDGQYTDFGILNSNCYLKINLELSTYPNPSQESFALQISTLEQTDTGIYAVNIRDISGRLLNSQKIELETGTTNLYFNDLTFKTGCYTVELIHESGRGKVIRHAIH